MDTKLADYKKAFEEKYPGTEVRFEAITDYEGDMAIRMQTEEYGDVLSVPEYPGTGDLPTYFEPLGTPEELSRKYGDLCHIAGQRYRKDRDLLRRGGYVCGAGVHNASGDRRLYQGAFQTLGIG